MFRHLERSNTPVALLTEGNIKLYDKGEVKLILSDEFVSAKAMLEHLDSDEPVHVTLPVPGIFYPEEKYFISDEKIALGLTIDLLRQPLSGKSVYVYKYGYTGVLPVDPIMYQLTEEDEIPVDSELVKVEFTNEVKTLGDLLVESFCYGFNEAANTYKKHSAELCLRNKHKYIIQYEIMRSVGGFGDRLADHSRLIAFLLKKVEPHLSEDEKTLLAQLSSPSVSELGGVVGREEIISDKVNKYKKGEEFVVP